MKDLFLLRRVFRHSTYKVCTYKILRINHFFKSRWCIIFFITYKFPTSKKLYMEKGCVKYEFYENILFIRQSSADYCCSVVLDRMKNFKTQCNTKWNVTLFAAK